MCLSGRRAEIMARAKHMRRQILVGNARGANEKREWKIK